MKIALMSAFAFLLSSQTIIPQVDLNNRIMLAQSFEQAGDYEKAAKLFEEIYAVRPENYQVFESLNKVYLQLKKYESSISLIESRLKINHEDVNLYAMLGTTYHMMGNEQKAYEIWDEGVKILPENPMRYRIVANAALQRRDFNKAIDYFKRGKSAAKNPEIFSYDLANIYSLTMQYKEAAEEYCSILSIQPTQLSNIENRILSYTNKPGALAQTIEVVESYEKDDNISYDYLLSRLYVEAKYFEKAYSLYPRIDEKQQNRGLEIYNFAQLVFKEGEYQLASKVFMDLAAKYPESPYASKSKLGYAKSLDAIMEKEISIANPQWKPYSYEVEVETEKSTPVINSYKALIEFYPNSEIAVEAYFRLGSLYFSRMNNSEEAKKYFNKILSDAPLSKFSVESSEQLAKIFLAEGKLQQAKEIYEQLIDNNRASEESRSRAKLQLAKILVSEGNFQAAKERLNSIISNLKDNAANDAIELLMLLNIAAGDSSNLLKFGKAEILSEQKKFTEAAELCKSISLDPNAFILHNISEIRQAEFELAVNNLENSVKILEKIASESEKNIYADKALYLLGKINQYGKMDYPKAIETYELLLEKYPNSLYQDECRKAILELRKKLS